MANNPMDAITAGCLRRVFAGESVENPIVQCVQIKPMQTNSNGAERFRVVFNDTVNFIQSMIAQRMHQPQNTIATTSDADRKQRPTIL